jgi:hypothetical protein
MLLAGLIREATLSADRRYRYTLLRRWGPKEGGVGWIMLNPSTADAEVDDPTIRRCMVFTQRLGFDAMLVVNLFALRATDPDEVYQAEDPTGPENGLWVRKACHQSKLLIAAWGAVPKKMKRGVEAVVKIIENEGYRLKCLGKTRNGQPRHPLYLRSDAPLMDWSGIDREGKS